MHFQDKGPWFMGRRVEGEVDGYFVQAQVFSESSQYGIGKGRISRLVIYPNRQMNFRDHLANYDRGWDGGAPTDPSIRTVVEKTVQYVDSKQLDWSRER